MQSALYRAKFLTLRFSGCGHLLPYHLGVSSVFLEEESRRSKFKPSNTSTVASKSKSKLVTEKASLPRIKAVSGSSAGAIAAVVYSQMPHRIEEYASEFIETRGRAIEILKRMLHEEERARSSVREVDNNSTPEIVTHGRSKQNQPPSLHIATTKCLDGSHNLFTFQPNLYPTISSSWNIDNILEAVRASCTIPLSFHPADIMFKNQSLSYPNSDGILIDGNHHVDGGIAAPAPSTPHDGRDGSFSITISPISAGAPLFQPKHTSDRRISPDDDSMRLLPLSNISCRGDFHVKPSIQNLRALRIASGVTSSEELREWYERGTNDALRMLRKWSEEDINTL